MPKPVRKLNYIPEILYDAPEYPGHKPSPIPYVVIPKDNDMPIGLFVLEYRKTGEYQVGDNGKKEEIEEGPFPHMYVEFDYLGQLLHELFPTLDMDKAIRAIRVGLGLKPTKEDSKKAGEIILNKVEAKAAELHRQATETQSERQKTIKDKLDKN